MSLRVAFAVRIAREEVRACLRAVPDITLTEAGDLIEIAQLVDRNDVLVISDPRGAEGSVLAEALRSPSNAVRWIQCISAGVDGITSQDVPPSIVLTNQGGATAPTVAEHALALLLGMARQIGPIYERSRRGTWATNFTPPIFALEGRTLAIVGFGNIGRNVARRAKAFDMRVLGLARAPHGEAFADEMHPLTELHAVLARADAVILCVASVPATHYLMNAAAFAACKKGALFVNVTRGSTVDSAAMRAALESGHLRAAAIDVTETEPLPDGDPLWQTPNLIISPHVGGAGGALTGNRIVATVVENLGRYLRNEPLLHRV